MPKHKYLTKTQIAAQKARVAAEDDALFERDMARRNIRPGVMRHPGYPGNRGYKQFPDEPNRLLGDLPLFTGSRYQADIAHSQRDLQNPILERLSAADVARFNDIDESVNRIPNRARPRTTGDILDPYVSGTRYDTAGIARVRAAEEAERKQASRGKRPSEASASSSAPELSKRESKMSAKKLASLKASQASEPDQLSGAVRGIMGILNETSLSKEQKLKIAEEELTRVVQEQLGSSGANKEQQLRAIQELMRQMEEEGETEGTGIGGSVGSTAYNMFNKMNRQMVKNVMVPGMDFVAGLIPAVMGQPELAPLAVGAAHAIGTAAQQPLLEILRSDKRQGKLDEKEIQRREQEEEDALMKKYKISGKGIMNQPRSRSVGSDMLSPMAAATMGHSQAMNMKLKLEKDMAMGRRKQVGLVGVSGNLLGPGASPALQSQPQQNFQFRHTIASPTYHPHVYGNGLYA